MAFGKGKPEVARACVIRTNVRYMLDSREELIDKSPLPRLGNDSEWGWVGTRVDDYVIEVTEARGGRRSFG